MVFISRGRSFEKVDMIGIPYKLTEFICEDESISCIELVEKYFLSDIMNMPTLNF